MYEAEVNRVVEPIGSLPSEVVQRFADISKEIESRTILPWGEHCTECNWPVCYTSCELYTPRTDGACRLFIDGMARIDFEGGANPYLLKIRFKQWGKLWTVGNLRLYRPGAATKKEKSNIAIGAVSRSLPLPSSVKGYVLRKVAYRRRQEAEMAVTTPESPDHFILECYNPNDRAINLTLTVRLRLDKSLRPFQKVVVAHPGYNRAKVPVSEIAQIVDLKQPFEVEIVPNDSDDTVLYFGLVDFAKSAPSNAPTPAATGSKLWKCVVWDLDNTLWDGTLIEDGPDKIRLRQDVVDIVKELDRRGILNSIASKNNHDDAMKVLRVCGLEEYFLHPQIHWQPKSQSIAKIAQSLNIGVDSLAFVDDQPFEREEVSSALPQVATVDAAERAGLTSRSECLVPVTDESRQRRLMYRQEAQRENILGALGGDYAAFLRECNIRLTLAPLNAENLERVYELAQRTNQMNFSGNRYPREQLQKLLQSTSHETFVMRCTDRFGSYGIVGFAVVEVVQPRLLDLMFSCRIQGKRVEHTFLSFLLNRYVGSRARDFFANYKKTSKNLASGKVFEELGFVDAAEKEGISTLVFPKDRELPGEALITIIDETAPVPV